MELADQLAAELHEAAVGKRRLLDPAARPAACLEHLHIDPGPVPDPGRPPDRRGPLRRRGRRSPAPQLAELAHDRADRERSASASDSWPGTVSASSQWFMRTSATCRERASSP